MPGFNRAYGFLTSLSIMPFVEILIIIQLRDRIQNMEIREKRIILRADDRGNDPAIYRGIDRLVTMGLLTQVSLMSNFTGSEERDLLLSAIDQSPLTRQGVDISLHINLVTGKPVSTPEHVPSLVDSGGVFRRPKQPTQSSWVEFVKTLKKDEAEREIDGQIEKFFRIFGHYPHSLNGHNYCETIPGLDEIVMQKAAELGVALNIPKTFTNKLRIGPFQDDLIVNYELLERYRKRGIMVADWGSTEHYHNTPTLDQSVNSLLRDLKSVRAGVTEFFFHPGDPDASVSTDHDKGRFSAARIRDFELLTHPEVQKQIAAMNLTCYQRLKQTINQ